jgi:DNA gyrase subunit B
LSGRILNVERARFDKMLSSQEVATLITALGCGIGADEFDINKLRYHRIILMTDADVDGSHIRTLLLTFFYRHLPQLIERGHVFIAQPPLYKVKKGKQERYLKDDAQREAYLMELALQEAAIVPTPEDQPVEGNNLQELGRLYLRMKRELERLKKRYHPAVLDAIREQPALAPGDLQDEARMKQWFEGVRDRLQANRTNGTLFEVEVFPSADGREFGGRVSINTHGLESVNVFMPEFFTSHEYRNLVGVENVYALRDAVVRRGEKSQPVTSMKAAFDWLLAEAAQGLHIQRYKGLGEMNPEQLWETTMDAKSRHLSQVRIEDAVAADEIFTTLMGDQVEPRREFIERHALSVENLDT